MPLYGSVQAARELLRALPGSSFNADQEARLVALRAAVSAWIEHETGRAFGDAAAAQTVAVSAPGVSDVLVLPKAVRTVDSVLVGATWNGSAWTGGAVLTADRYRPVFRTKTGEALGLAMASGAAWFGTVVVTGTWEDGDADASVPDDITYLANRLVAEFFKAEQASASGTIGENGNVIPLKNATKDPLVAGILARWRVADRLVV